METEIAHLHEQHPKLYGALRSNLEEVVEAIKQCPYQYPRASQVRESIESPSANTRSCGQALTGLAKLDVIDVYTERANSNRYDLTNFKPERVRSLQQSLAADVDRQRDSV
jgi:hypothetical protein